MAEEQIRLTGRLVSSAAGDGQGGPDLALSCSAAGTPPCGSYGRPSERRSRPDLAEDGPRCLAPPRDSPPLRSTLGAVGSGECGV
uniref:Uncharacterized protein n=1 Tax=Arundo donax TaxID=35708 RepID=A0A0A9AMJ5_ARUDO